MTYLKLPTLKILILILVFSCLSMASIDPTGLLIREDLDKEIADQSGPPALSSTLIENPQWKSFDTWRCFVANDARIEITEFDDESTTVPTLTVTDDRVQYELSLDPEPDLDTQKIAGRWTELLQGEGSFCVYAAYLPAFENSPQSATAPDTQYWIVNQLKTGRGLWHLEDEANRRRDDTEEIDDSATVSQTVFIYSRPDQAENAKKSPRHFR